MMSHKSITTPDTEHNIPNILTEFIWLNKDIRCGPFPWKDNAKWGKTIAALKKLMGPAFELTPEQIAFYIWQCKPQEINPKEFAKMAVVAKRLFRKLNLDQVHRLYSDKRKELISSGIEHIAYKNDKPKSLKEFLLELEDENRL